MHSESDKFVNNLVLVLLTEDELKMVLVTYLSHDCL